MEKGHIFGQIPGRLPEELIETLLTGGQFRLERIVSKGHATPQGQWYDQDQDEWVILLKGRARLRVEGQASEVELGPGDHIGLAAHVRHRVEWTDPAVETVWLAVHYQEESD